MSTYYVIETVNDRIIGVMECADLNTAKTLFIQLVGENCDEQYTHDELEEFFLDGLFVLENSDYNINVIEKSN